MGIGYFEIYAEGENKIEIITPNGGEEIAQATTYTIKWDAQVIFNAYTRFAIYYSTNAGQDWNLINSNVNISTREYNWTVPNVVSSLCLIRIDGVDNSGNVICSDTSDSFFKIYNPNYNIQVVSPNGGEEWYYTTTQDIRFDDIGKYKAYRYAIYYSVDGGKNWTTISTRAFSPYSWTVPILDAPSDKCLILVQGLDSSGYVRAVDISDNYFSILPLKIHITHPKDGAEVGCNRKLRIVWDKLNASFSRYRVKFIIGDVERIVADYISPETTYVESLSPKDPTAFKIVVEALTSAGKVVGAGSVSVSSVNYKILQREEDMKIFQKGKQIYVLKEKK